MSKAVIRNISLFYMNLKSQRKLAIVLSLGFVMFSGMLGLFVLASLRSWYLQLW